MRSAAVAGLVVAWGGTALLASPQAMRMAESSVPAQLASQGVLWLLCAAVVGIVLFWERRSLGTLWLRPFGWMSLFWAAVLVGATLFAILPATEWLRTTLGLPGYAAGMERAVASPLWLRILAVVTAGIVEEILFRGYAVTRLRELTGSTWFAIVCASLVFAALHYPVWGPGATFAFFVGGLATTAYFVWRRDLLAMIVAHVAIDFWGLVVSPTLSEWWT